MVKRLCVFVVLLLVSVDTRGQWEQLPGPDGGRANSFVEIAGSKGQRVYAATDNGVWFSGDGMYTWKVAGLQSLSILHLLQFTDTSKKEILFAASYDSLYSSLDSGASWTANLGGWPIYSLIQSDTNFFVSIGEQDTTALGGIVRSTDLGNTWHEFAHNTPAGEIVLSGLYLVGLDNRTRRLSVAGGAWVNVGPAPVSTQRIFANGNILYSYGGNKVCISTDHGMSWTTPVNSGLRNLDYSGFTPVTSLAVSGGTLLVADTRSTWRSTDTAKSWTRIDGISGFPRSISNSLGGGLAFIDSQFVAGNIAGIVASKDVQNWEYRSNGIRAADVYDLTIFNGELLAATSRGICRSTDNGESWTYTDDSLGLRDSLVNRFIVVDSSLYACSDSGGFWRWDKTHWTTLSDLLASGVGNVGGDLFASLNGNGYAPRGVSKSTDSGKSWTLVNNGLPFDSADHFPATNGLFSYRSRLFVRVSYYPVDTGGSFGDPVTELWTSTDKGNSWQWLYELPAYTGYVFNAVADSTLYISLSNGGAVLKSNDGGLTWTGIPHQEGSSFIGVVGHGVAVAYQNAPINLLEYISNVGSTKILLSGDSTSTPQAVVSDDTYAYVATSSRGVWRVKLPALQLGVPMLPSCAASLLQVFPNPTPNKTTVSFTLTERGHVSLKLYDELGALRMTLFDGEMEAGDHTWPFATRDLPSGIYTIVLSTPIKREVGRLIREP